MVRGGEDICALALLPLYKMGMDELKKMMEASNSWPWGVVSWVFLGPDRIQETKFSFRERLVSLLAVVVVDCYS